tara:strand:+ start:4177 stop:7122 length:2946 start_codon:yes stop_codon:yes gene_type:complete
VLPEPNEGESYAFVKMKASFIEGKSTLVHKWKDSPQEILQLANTTSETALNAEHNVQHHNTYYSLATFDKSKELTDFKGRSQSNAVHIRCLFADIDVGKSSDKDNARSYSTREEAISALNKFVADVNIPKPITITTGSKGGIHAYWPFTDKVRVEEWVKLAKNFEELCKQHKLKVDTNVTTDCSRILRVPNTFNFNDGFGSKAFKVKLDDPSLSIEDVEVKDFDWYVDTIPDFTVAETDSAFNEKINSDKWIYSYQTMEAKNEEGTGCEQIQKAYEDQENVDYQLWRAVLSILIKMRDGSKAIHDISNKHPDYDFDVTEAKAKDTIVHKCSTFEQLRPDICKKCAHRNSGIGTPLTLAREDIKDEFRSIENVDSDTGLTTTMSLPDDYYLGDNGEIMLDIIEKKKTRSTVIHHRLFYITDRRFDPEEGTMILARLVTSNDGNIDFEIPGDAVNNPSALKTILGKNDIFITEGYAGAQRMVDYIIAWSNHLAAKQAATRVSTQFGWNTLNSKETPKSFGFGAELYTKGGVKPNPVRRGMRRYFSHLCKAGELSGWTKGVQELYGAKGEESRQFCLGVSLATPMVRDIQGIDGAVISLYSQGSGHMKTATIRTVASIWGNPYEMEKSGETSAKAALKDCNMYKSIPLCVDETTNSSPDKLSEIAYGVTSGKEKDRLKQTGQELWSNEGRWNLIAFLSTNISAEKILATKQKSAQGELARIFELKLPKNKNSDSENSRMVSDVLNNYGHAGTHFVKWLLEHDDNREECLQLMNRIEEKISKKIDSVVSKRKHSNSSRFYAALGRIGLTGIVIGNKLKLWDFDESKIYHWYIEYLENTMESITSYREDCRDILARLLTENHNLHTLVINSSVDLRKKKQDNSNKPTHIPRANLLIRYEPDKGLYFVNSAFLTEWIRNETSIKLEELADGLGGIVESRASKKNMLKGFNPDSEGDFSDADVDELTEVPCWVFDARQVEEVSSEDIP